MLHRLDRCKGSRSAVHGVLARRWQALAYSSLVPPNPAIVRPAINCYSRLYGDIRPRIENTITVLEAASALDSDITVLRYRGIVKAFVQRFHACRRLIGPFV
jgi:hypothetical protein